MGLGVVLIVSAAAVMAFVMFRLWARVRAPIAFSLAALSGLAVAAGGLLVQDEAGPASWWVALLVLGALGPLHARLICGPPGTAS